MLRQGAALALCARRPERRSRSAHAGARLARRARPGCLFDAERYAPLVGVAARSANFMYRRAMAKMAARPCRLRVLLAMAMQARALLRYSRQLSSIPVIPLFSQKRGAPSVGSGRPTSGSIFRVGDQLDLIWQDPVAARHFRKKGLGRRPGRGRRDGIFDSTTS
jgi:hypothetical protein